MIVDKVSEINAVYDFGNIASISFYLNGEHECFWQEGCKLECDTLAKHEINIASLFLITRGFSNSSGFIKQLKQSKYKEFLF